MQLKLPIFILCSVLFAWVRGNAQACSTLGQSPSGSFPVCGTTTFVQNTVPICNGTNLPCPPCSGGLFADRNSFWYKFTCFASGSLGFQITPNNLSDDYDWQLFDVTGHNPVDVYTDASLFVCCNWSGNVGITGTSPSATTASSCEGGTPNFSKMPMLTAGHEYLLMVSHFTNSQSGYSLSFAGGSSTITDATPPALSSVRADCSGTKLLVKLNKSIKCSSLANGTEFSLNTPSPLVAGAVGVGCSSSFDMDSVVVSLNSPLPAGNYTFTVNNGSDMNTLLDNCGNGIAVGDNKAFSFAPSSPTLMDSISPVPCSANNIQLVFRTGIQCSSIANDGSDFVITGPAPVTVTNAVGNCGADGLTNMVTVNLAVPISVAGNYQIKLVKGTDNNALLNECNLETPINSTLNFLGLSAADASFTYQLKYGCKEDTVSFSYTPSNGITQWKWSFDDNTTSSANNPIKFYTQFGARTVKLWASNTVCEDSTTQAISLLNDTLKAGFSAPEYLCPNDVVVFADTSLGQVVTWNWDFGNSQTSTQQVPVMPSFMPVNKETKVPIRLIVTGKYFCIDTAYRSVKLIPTCKVAVPSAFTPNGDGLNDYLYPVNAYKADKLVFKVFNRYGQLVFSTQDWTVRWDGKVNGKAQDGGVYVWILQYTDRDTGQQVSQKGTSVLMR